MLGKLLPILLALVGTGIGIGAGVALRPPPAPPMEIHPCGPGEEAMAEEDEMEAPEEEATDSTQNEFVRFANQFVVSVVDNDKIVALVVMSLNVEVLPGNTDEVFRQQPKLRDAFLQVMFNHANIGGFDGAFTDTNKMTLLRNALLETARSLMGEPIVAIHIQDLVRQDL